MFSKVKLVHLVKSPATTLRTDNFRFTFAGFVVPLVARAACNFLAAEGMLKVLTLRFASEPANLIGVIASKFTG